MPNSYERQQDLLVARTQLIDEKRGRRWNTTAEGRQNTVDLVENTVVDETVPILIRLLAAKIHVGIEAQNQADQRLEANAGGGDDREPQVILVLPANGSELGHVDADDMNEECVDDDGENRQVIDNEGDDQNGEERNN